MTVVVTQVTQGSKLYQVKIRESLYKKRNSRQEKERKNKRKYNKWTSEQWNKGCSCVIIRCNYRSKQLCPSVDCELRRERMNEWMDWGRCVSWQVRLGDEVRIRLTWPLLVFMVIRKEGRKKGRKKVKADKKRAQSEKVVLGRNGSWARKLRDTGRGTGVK